MSTGFGGTVKLTGESEYKKALKDITSSLKLVSSELKLTNTEFSNGDKSVKQTKTSYDNMSKSLEEQKSKVRSLKEALAQAEKEYGSNNERVKMFKTQLNNAENQLKQMEDATDKSTKELKEMKEGFDEAGKGAIKFGDLLKANVLGDFITSGLKTVSSAIKQVGSTLLSVGKDALNSYADYEQLVGGVETLFKDNANTVENYANNAYKTSGLSANEYMETVTSFSASLLQSLNNDTAKSAEVANMAIIDMSDNANKMGTDMSMIQNAYQGFAKQNYTMLDNLKLGYGGTKTEMERLLADATKISGVKYNISSLNDVYQAIHVIQGELGITGTTAKEASTTISGSISSMKSAWTNLLTGIADDNADFRGLIDNFVDSILTVGDNIIPRLKIIIDGVVNLVLSLSDKLIEYLPTLLETGMSLLQKIIDGIVSMIPQLMPVVSDIIISFVGFVTDNLPTILQVGTTILLELIKGISDALPELIPMMTTVIMDMGDILLDNIDEIIECGIQLLVALTEGVMNALPELVSRLPEIIIKITNTLIQLTPQLLSAALRIIATLAEGLIKFVPEITSRIPEIIKSIISALKDGVTDFKEIGSNLLKGLWEGMSNTVQWLKNKIKSMVGNVTDFIKNLFGIHSPSTLFRDEIGTNLALGIGEGFEGTMKNVTTDMQNSIPTEFDVSSTINNRVDGGKGMSLENLTRAFVTAIKSLNAQIIIDKSVAGKLVIDLTNEGLGRIY